MGQALACFPRLSLLPMLLHIKKKNVWLKVILTALLTWTIKIKEDCNLFASVI